MLTKSLYNLDPCGIEQDKHRSVQYCSAAVDSELETQCCIE
jgi:hypothetical protein